MVDLAQIPRDVKARVCNAAAHAAGHTYPQQALPAIALREGLTVDVVKAIVHHHGWPHAKSLRNAAGILARGGDIPTTHTAGAGPAGEADGQTLQVLDVEDLTPDPQNVREDLGDLAELAKSIRDVGILQPVVARRHHDQLVIVMGHRRHAAAKLAGLHQIPVIVRGDMDPDECLAAMIVENGQRLGLDPIEEARALARLKRADQATDAVLGDRISKSQGYVSGRLALLSLTARTAACWGGRHPLPGPRDPTRPRPGRHHQTHRPGQEVRRAPRLAPPPRREGLHRLHPGRPLQEHPRQTRRRRLRPLLGAHHPSRRTHPTQHQGAGMTTTQSTADSALLVGREALRAQVKATPPPDPHPAVDAVAHVICAMGGHLPGRDSQSPGACEFHRRVAFVALDQAETALTEASSCSSCGCTDDLACEGGCWWVAPRLCSTCGAGA